MTICERIFRDFKFELPSTKVRRFVVTAALVDQPAADLRSSWPSTSRRSRRSPASCP